MDAKTSLVDHELKAFPATAGAAGQFRVTFGKQFRAVFLKSVSAEVRQRKLLACQIAVPLLLVVVCLIVELTLADFGSGDSAPDDADVLLPYASALLPSYRNAYAPYTLVRDATAPPAIGRADNGTWPCNAHAGSGLLGFIRQSYVEQTWWRPNGSHLVYGGCSPNFEDSPSWADAEAEYEKRTKRFKEITGKHGTYTDQEVLEMVGTPQAVWSFSKVDVAPSSVALNATLYYNDRQSYTY
jgi:hypothetical protein